MAVVSCAECGGTVSNRAAACPHCGAPVGAAARVPVASTPPRVDPSADVCLSCLSLVRGEEKARAPVWPGVLLVMAYVIPGIIYFIWRRSTKRKQCPLCGSNALVPATSQRGTEILAGKAAPAIAAPEPENCPACMLPISVPAGVLRVSCPHCTSVVERTKSGSLVVID